MCHTHYTKWLCNRPVSGTCVTHHCPSSHAGASLPSTPHVPCFPTVNRIRLEYVCPRCVRADETNRPRARHRELRDESAWILENRAVFYGW
jgi:hypothetical protein